ncbi:MAG TPA: hypothetical protein DDY20_03785 [Desulfobulbaceae bacterium]|nr:hypothetical protein [Desulfobulbaceae bacterium]
MQPCILRRNDGFFPQSDGLALTRYFLNHPVSRTFDPDSDTDPDPDCFPPTRREGEAQQNSTFSFLLDIPWHFD